MSNTSVSVSVVYLLSVLLVSGCQQQSKQQDAAKQVTGATISQIFSDTATPASVQNNPEHTEDNPENRATPSGPSSAVSPSHPSANAGASQSQSANAQISNGRQTAITRAVEKVSPAVVSITVTETVSGGRRLAFNEYYNRFFTVPIEREVSSMGSGFIISEDGLIVTNQHVANENAKEIMVSLPDGSQFEADVVGSDELADLTLLKIQADEQFPFVEFGNSKDVIVGQWSLAVGNPFGLFESAQPSVTVGVISATNRDFRPDPNEPRVYMDMLQTDASINQGNSGGPLVDSEGKVIGVNTFIFTGGRGSGSVGLGFAIPSDRVQKIIDQLTTSGEVQLTYDPGFNTVEMNYNLAVKYNLPIIRGLLVQSVNRDGPAFEAGIMPGDIILKVGEVNVQSKMHAQALFREYEEGDSMSIELLRKGNRYKTEMMLRKKVRE